MGLEKERYEIIETPTQFKEVLVPEECAHSLWNYTEEYNLIFNTLIENASKKAEVPFFPKLYITHSQWSGAVNCVNESVFEEFFQRLDFHVFAPEKFSLAEQILYLNNAQEVVTTLGTTAHLGLFCRPNTFFACLARAGRYSDEVLSAQTLISRARRLNVHVVDTSCNFLHDYFSYGVVNLSFNGNFQNFCRDIWGEEAFLLSQRFSLKTQTDAYIRQWAKYYSNPNNFKKIQHLSAFDFVSKMAYELNGEVLDKKKFVPPPPAPKPAPPPAPPKKKPLPRPPLPYKTRLLNKLKKNPQSFFSDSHNPALRVLGKICFSPRLSSTLGKGLIVLTQKFLR